jgi:endonuclease/exonuclease/phosphatase family metal-dependent hydrolase
LDRCRSRPVRRALLTWIRPAEWAALRLGEPIHAQADYLEHPVRSAGGGADLGRVVAALDRFSEFDVLCLQEVACGFNARDGSPLGDQFSSLAARLPGYSLSCATPLDTLAADGLRCRMGTAVFSRYPVLQVLRHSLPWPADPAVMSMPRAALEVTLGTPNGPLRVLSVHLEYFSALQRRAQVDRLRALHARGGHARAPAPAGLRPMADRSPPCRAPRPAS